MEPVKIRTADPDRDAAACVEIYSPYVEAGATSFEEAPPSPAEFAERIAATLATYPGSSPSAGERWSATRTPARTARVPPTAGRRRSRCTWREGQRRTGCGRALYGELAERLRRQGFHVACAGITLPNEASVALHEEVGFVPVGVYRRIGWKDGGWRDVGWWQLELTPPGDGPPPEPQPPEHRPRLPLADA